MSCYHIGDALDAIWVAVEALNPNEEYPGEDELHHRQYAPGEGGEEQVAQLAPGDLEGHHAAVSRLPSSEAVSSTNTCSRDLYSGVRARRPHLPRTARAATSSTGSLPAA